MEKSQEQTSYEHDDNGEDLLPSRIGRDVAKADGGERGAGFKFTIEMTILPKS
jgi:hypothetical protein